MRFTLDDGWCSPHTMATNLESTRGAEALVTLLMGPQRSLWRVTPEERRAVNPTIRLHLRSGRELVGHIVAVDAVDTWRGGGDRGEVTSVTLDIGPVIGPTVPWQAIEWYEQIP